MGSKQFSKKVPGTKTTKMNYLKWLIGIILAVVVVYSIIDFVDVSDKRYATMDEAIKEGGYYNIADYLFSKLILGTDSESIVYIIMGDFAIDSNNKLYQKDDQGWLELDINPEAFTNFQDEEDPSIISSLKYYRILDQHVLVVSHWNAPENSNIVIADTQQSMFMKLQYQKNHAPGRIYTDFLLVIEEIPENYKITLNGQYHFQLDRVE